MRYVGGTVCGAGNGGCGGRIIQFSGDDIGDDGADARSTPRGPSTGDIVGDMSRDVEPLLLAATLILLMLGVVWWFDFGGGAGVVETKEANEDIELNFTRCLTGVIGAT